MKPENANWRYDALPKTGTCRIDGKIIVLTITLYGDSPKRIDVLDAEKWIAKAVKEPSTVEGIAKSVAELFPDLWVQCCGQTDTHGLITARYKA